MHIGLKIDIYVPYCLDTCNKYLCARVSRISGTRVPYLNLLGNIRDIQRGMETECYVHWRNKACPIGMGR